jgi:polyhydroxybutyrate depolymerase
MKTKIVGILIFMLLISTTFSSFGLIINSKSIDLNEKKISNKILNDKLNVQELNHKFRLMIHDFRIRTYLMYIPSSYDESEPVSLVLVLHGGPNTARNSSERFGVSELAEEEGFIVVYPNGVCKLPFRRTWNMGFGFWSAYYLNVDDVGFIKKLIEKMQNNYNIDPDRIFIAGHSAGAMMTYRLAAELSDIVAAIASNGGAIGGHITNNPLWQIPEPSNPVSVAEFHGKLDYAVPYDGGWNQEKTVFYLSVNDSMSFWVEQNGCDIEPDTNTSENVTIDKYGGGAAGTEVWIYTVHNKGHIWFGGPSWEDPDPVISTTDEMWEFFKTHPKG